MPKKNRLILTAAFFLLLSAPFLAACGGGSSGSSSAIPLPDEIADVPRAQSVSDTRYAELRVEAAAAENAPDNFGDGIDEDYKLVVNFASDDEAIAAFSEDAPYAILLFKPADGGSETPYFLIFGDSDVDEAVALLSESEIGAAAEDGAFATGDNLLFPVVAEYSVMGVWVEDAPDFFDGSAYDADKFKPLYLGLETAAAGISARNAETNVVYNGEGLGIYADDGGDRYLLISENMDFTVNFSTPTISGGGDLHALLPEMLLEAGGMLPGGVDLDDGLNANERTTLNALGLYPLALHLDFSSTGINADGTFSGTADVTSVSDNRPAELDGLDAVSNGEFNGRFYGPNAEELAGVAEIEGNNDKLSLGFIAAEE